jgi:hypothetical protein
VQRWGSLFGIEAAPGPVEPSVSLDFWIAANARAVELGQALGERFMVVNFDELGRDPRSVLPGLIEFLGCRASAEQLAALAAQLHVPSTMGRYRSAGLSAFSAEQLERVRELGFAVEA